METNYNSGYNKGSYNSHYQKDNELVVYSTESERAVFYRKTYTHVALAILAFILVETALLHLVPVELIEAMFGRRFIWLLIIGGFWLGSVMAAKWSHSLNKNTQYLGLGFYVLLESIIFLPLIYMALAYVGTEVLWQAAIITLSLFAGLTMGVAGQDRRTVAVGVSMSGPWGLLGGHGPVLDRRDSRCSRVRDER